MERAVDDLVDTVVNFPLESEDLGADSNEINKLRSHYERLMYTAVLHATKQRYVCVYVYVRVCVVCVCVRV